MLAYDVFIPLFFPLQPALDTVLSRMWRHGEDGQEARTLQKLPEASVRPVAQEQVGVVFRSLKPISLRPSHS